jgi:lysophospholipase L1-like esterase
VGGSSVGQVAARASKVVTCNPEVLTVLIGANDLYNWNPAVTTQHWLNKLWAYTDSMRAKGFKVAVGTILPRYMASNPSWSATFNQRRAQANSAIRGAVGVHIDAVIDFAADPVMGPDAAAQDKTLYYDGLHPTDACGMGCGGQGKLAVIYTPVVDRLLAQ